MFGYIIKRLLWIIPVLIGVSLILFGIMQMIPGDPASVLLGPKASQEAVETLNKRFGLEEPLHIQYYLLMKNFVTGRLESIYYKVEVIEIISQKLRATVELGLTALVIAVVLAIPIGILAAVKKNSVFDYFSMMLATLGISIPVFFTGILLIYIFSVIFNVLPSSGYGGPLWTKEGWAHLILPAFSLSSILIASTSRLTRSSMLEVLQEDFIRTARAKGVKEAVVVNKHAFKNAMIPVITNIGNQLAMLFGGAILTETVFAWPGIGRLAVKAVSYRDQPLVFGTILVLSFLYVVTNLIIDILYVFINPQISYS
ncbi:MAG TPA: ABC transporter permease [Halanaerobiales bacterium]|nr:ABC transporter permease [Halanaerobiales bacterium]